MPFVRRMESMDWWSVPDPEEAGSIGSLIALPMQGSALRNGNSAFIDHNWNACPDQWKKLLETRKMSREEVEGYIAKWQGELFGRQKISAYVKDQNRPKPWKRQQDFDPSDVVGTLHIVLADGVYIDALNLKPRLQNQIRCMAGAIYDAGNYMDTFEQDLVEAEQEIVISSPGLTQEKVERFLYLIKPRQEKGVKIAVITENPENSYYENAAYIYGLLTDLNQRGVYVITADHVQEHFAVIDQLLVWHGGMNLLGKEDVWDNLIRVKDKKAAAELLEMIHQIMVPDGAARNERKF